MKSSGTWRVLLLVAPVTSEGFLHLTQDPSDNRYRLLIIDSFENKISKMQGVSNEETFAIDSQFRHWLKEA